MKTLLKPRVDKKTDLKPHPIPHYHVHWTVINDIRMYCIQPNCDGTHHFYCSCRVH